MAKTPESVVKEYIKNKLNDGGHMFTMPTTFGMGASGVADIIACIYGVFVAIEVKRGDLKPTKLQAAKLKAVRDSGGVGTYVNLENLNNFAKFMTALDELLKTVPEPGSGKKIYSAPAGLIKTLAKEAGLEVE